MLNKKHRREKIGKYSWRGKWVIPRCHHNHFLLSHNIQFKLIFIDIHFAFFFFVQIKRYPIYLRKPHPYLGFFWSNPYLGSFSSSYPLRLGNYTMGFRFRGVLARHWAFAHGVGLRPRGIIDQKRKRDQIILWLLLFCWTKIFLLLFYIYRYLKKL